MPGRKNKLVQYKLLVYLNIKIVLLTLYRNGLPEQNKLYAALYFSNDNVLFAMSLIQLYHPYSVPHIILQAADWVMQVPTKLIKNSGILTSW